MDLTINGANQQYISDLQTTQNQINLAQAQLSSGYVCNRRRTTGAISQIYELQTQIALNQQTQTNLGGASAELSAADTALQTAIQGGGEREFHRFARRQHEFHAPSRPTWPLRRRAFSRLW